jgi:hypothetical protein
MKYKLLIISFVFILPVLAYGNTYETLTSIPLYDEGDPVQIEAALQVFFAISVAVAAVLAVIMLSIGGFRYMASESVFNKSDSKEQIRNAIVGLLIVLTSVVALAFINPDIVNIGQLFQLPGGYETQSPGVGEGDMEGAGTELFNELDPDGSIGG